MSCHDVPGGATARRTQHPAGGRTVGNPNAGKSTLFNALTGLNVKVTNCEVTVAKHRGMQVAGRSIVVEDLPGSYSLDPISPDEEVVARTLDLPAALRPDAILVVLDDRQRSLGSVARVQQLRLPTMTVLTFGDELARRRAQPDAGLLAPTPASGCRSSRRATAPSPRPQAGAHRAAVALSRGAGADRGEPRHRLDHLGTAQFGAGPGRGRGPAGSTKCSCIRSSALIFFVAMALFFGYSRSRPPSGLDRDRFRLAGGVGARPRRASAGWPTCSPMG